MRKYITLFSRVVIATLTGMIIIFFILVYWPLSYINYPEKDYEVLIIENATIMDVEKDTMHLNQRVIIRDGIIKKISSTGTKNEIDGSRRVKLIDGSGKFLMPALWDMHVHLTKQSPHIAYPAFIGNGITHVRDMRGAYEERDPFAGVQSRLMKWDREVKELALIGPRLHGITSFAIEGQHNMFKSSPKFFNCATSEDAAKLVGYLSKRGITLIKVYNNISREAFFTLMKESAKAGIDVAGHKPLRVSTIEASNAGMKSIEHARFFIQDSYPSASDLRQFVEPGQAENTALRKEMLEKHDTILLYNMFAAFTKNKTWYCPTHLTRRQDAFAGDKSFRARYKNINPIVQFISFEDLDATIQEDTSRLAQQVYLDFYLKGLQISGAAYKNGIKILAGSDIPELPGSSLHEELIELSKAGLPNFEILRTATLYPAQYYGLDTLYGSVKEGKMADLLLLNNNPFLDIRNTQSITGVVMKGKYLDKLFLDGLSRKVNRRQKSLIMSAKLLWDMIIYTTI